MNGRASADTFDVAIVGGGLAGGLCAVALAARAPALTVALIERAPSLGGNQTWCCHRSDLLLPGGPSIAPWFSGLLDYSWPAYQVRFANLDRVLEGDYLCVRSQSLARATEQSLHRPGRALLTGRTVHEITHRRVVSSDGETVHARLVLDARGGDLSDFDDRCGYQKFVGWEIALDPSCQAPPALPVLMDATVEQIDGYRFVYVLPFSPCRLLVEDTTFSRNEELDRETVRARLRAYLVARGWAGSTVLREEAGILPMPWSPSARDADALAIGYRGGMFHPGTGYSLARAALAAEALAHAASTSAPDELVAKATKVLEGLRAGWRSDDRFARWLNRLAFRVLPPARLRDRVFERVYRLPAPVLARFYAGRTSLRDRLAIAAAPLRLPAFRRHPTILPELGGNA